MVAKSKSVTASVRKREERKHLIVRKQPEEYTQYTLVKGLSTEKTLTGAQT